MGIGLHRAKGDGPPSGLGHHVPEQETVRAARERHVKAAHGPAPPHDGRVGGSISGIRARTWAPRSG